MGIYQCQYAPKATQNHDKCMDPSLVGTKRSGVQKFRKQHQRPLSQIAKNRQRWTQRLCSCWNCICRLTSYDKYFCPTELLSLAGAEGLRPHWCAHYHRGINHLCAWANHTSRPKGPPMKTQSFKVSRSNKFIAYVQVLIWTYSFYRHNF